MLERWRTHHLLLAEAGLWDGQALHADFAAWCSAHAGRGCTLWLSAACLLELVCETGLPLADDQAALVWAQRLLQHYHGDAAAAWPLAAWQQGEVRGVSALHGVDLQDLRGIAQRHRVRLQAVKPWWSLVLALALRRHRALRQGRTRLLVVEGARVMAVDLDQARVTALSQRRLDAAEPGALQALAAAQGPTVAVGYGLCAGAATGVHLLDGLQEAQAPAAWLAAKAAFA